MTEPHRDALPEELDVTAYVGPYLFPDIRRRRIAGAILAVLAVASLGAGIAAGESGLIAAGALLAAIAAYHFAAASPAQSERPPRTA